MPGVEQFEWLTEGRILDGKYRVERMLGVGGMGIVVAARHLQLDERVALKFLRPELAASLEAITRFIREARSAVKIKSEHVARVTDVGQLDSGAPYMVMEYLEGEDLGSWIARRGPLPIERAVEFVIQACVALAEAHALGIVHRDLKPSNLFSVRGPDGRPFVKVLDFGISKMTSLGMSVREASTNTGALMGSPIYMSPEQMQSAKDVDLRTDIWALGVTLYQLLSGCTPFGGATLAEMIVSIATRSPADLCATRPEVPEALEVVVMRCLQKDRRLRYANVADLATDLLRYGPPMSRGAVDKIAAIVRASGQPVIEAMAAVTSEPKRGPTTQTALTGTETALTQTAGAGKPALPGKRILVAGAAAAVVAVGALIAMKTIGSRPPAGPTVASSLPTLAPAPPTTQATAEVMEREVDAVQAPARAVAGSQMVTATPLVTPSPRLAPSLPAAPSRASSAQHPAKSSPAPVRATAASKAASAPASETKATAPAPADFDPANPIFGLQPK